MTNNKQGAIVRAIEALRESKGYISCDYSNKHIDVRNFAKKLNKENDKAIKDLQAFVDALPDDLKTINSLGVIGSADMFETAKLTAEAVRDD